MHVGGAVEIKLSRETKGQTGMGHKKMESRQQREDKLYMQH